MLVAHRDIFGSRPLCFRRLLAGGYHDMFNTQSHAGKEPLISLYRQVLACYCYCCHLLAMAPHFIFYKFRVHLQRHRVTLFGLLDAFAASAYLPRY